MTARRTLTHAVLGLVTSTTLPLHESAAEDLEPPRLVVVVTVDGLSPIQLGRVSDLFTGGLARLTNEGISFEQCFQDHAVTYTGPGHFALMSGRYPGPAGVIANSWFDPALGEWVYCVEDDASTLLGTPEGSRQRRAGGSYRNVGGSTVGDWLKRSSPESKVFSFARKDRSAVMLGGRSADGVYWYDERTGAFVTSSFYVNHVPPWVEAYNRRRRADDFRHERWERLLADVDVYESRARADSFPGEEDFSSLATGNAASSPCTFDHWVAGRAEVPDTRYYAALAEFPFADMMTMELVYEALDSEALGVDEHPDLLCIGLSANDNACHRAGPLSQETIDVVLRVDRLLGDLFEHLDRSLGPVYTVALSSDHGVLPLPEYVERGHRDLIGGHRARRVVSEAKDFRQTLEARLAALAGGRSIVAAVDAFGFWVDWNVVRANAVDPDDIEREVRALASHEEWIAHVFSREELLASYEEDDDLLRRYRHSVHPSLAPDFFICAEPGILFDRTGTTHGSPHDYDTHVPLMLWGVGVLDGPRRERVATVDLAPTLARLLMLDNIPALDGRVLGAALDPALR